MCVCVCVGGGGSSDFFHFPKFQGGPTYVIQWGGGGRQTFYQGSGVQLLSNRTCDLYWTPCPYYRSAQLSQILIDYSDSPFGCLFSSFIMYPPIDACFTLI